MKSITEQAYEYAKKKHDETGKLYNGQPYIVHPELTANIIFNVLRQINRFPEDLDNNLIAAGYLHDVLEDTEVTYHELRHLFGADIADLVQEVTQDENKNFPNLKTARGLILKTADQMANVSNLDTMTDKEKQKKLLRKYSYCYMHRGDILKKGAK